MIVKWVRTKMGFKSNDVIVTLSLLYYYEPLTLAKFKSDVAVNGTFSNTETRFGMYNAPMHPARLIVTVAMSVGTSVKINELRVPEIIRHGTAAVLDCDYTLDDAKHSDGLVVKWFFNDQSRPVYQWIPGAMKPQGLGVLKNKLNLEYRASSDVRTMHRALHILEPSAELSGVYTCVVSTFQNEDKQSKRMLVFVPERSLLVAHGKSENGAPNVMCTAEGVFPQPEMTVRMGNEEIESTIVLRRESDGLFDISAVATLPDDVIDNPADFACELRVLAANYTVRREFVYYPGNDGDTVTFHRFTFFLPMLLQYLLYSPRHSIFSANI